MQRISKIETSNDYYFKSYIETIEDEEENKKLTRDI